MKTYVIANWKLYLSVAKSVSVARQLVRAEAAKKIPRDVELVIAPSMLALAPVARVLAQARSKIRIAAQDCWIADSGAYTGDVSPRELRQLGVTYVIVGHSERREHHDESEHLLVKKIAAATAAGLRVIYCVGETKEERNAGRARSVVRTQLRAVRGCDISVVAYEPRWAIGTGLPIEPIEAAQMHTLIASEMGEDVAVCYGGSVSERNAASFLTAPHTNGVLVGSAATVAASLVKIVNAL